MSKIATYQIKTIDGDYRGGWCHKAELEQMLDAVRYQRSKQFVSGSIVTFYDSRTSDKLATHTIN